METARLKDVLSWIKTTDLVEVSFKEAGEGFALSTPEAPPDAIPEARFPSRYQCVTSPAVGLFQPQLLGQAKAGDEGREVAEGDSLGVIDGGGKSQTSVPAPCAGRVARVLVEPNQAVQYGQPLFLIEPR